MPRNPASSLTARRAINPGAKQIEGAADEAAFCHRLTFGYPVRRDRRVAAGGSPKPARPLAGRAEARCCGLGGGSAALAPIRKLSLERALDVARSNHAIGRRNAFVKQQERRRLRQNNPFPPIASSALSWARFRRAARAGAAPQLRRKANSSGRRPGSASRYNPVRRSDRDAAGPRDGRRLPGGLGPA